MVFAIADVKGWDGGQALVFFNRMGNHGWQGKHPLRRGLKPPLPGRATKYLVFLLKNT